MNPEAEQDDFVCYHCKENDCANCVGVPCMCDCPDPRTKPTDKQLVCKHERLRRILTTFGPVYLCESCELKFDEPDWRLGR